MLKYGVLTFHDVYDSVHTLWSRLDSRDKQVVNLLNETIKAFAKRDNTLIIGRGGFVVLKDYQNVLNVLLRAPFEYRVRNAMQTEQINDILEAEKAVRQNDEVRQSFLQTFYNVDPNDVRGFNLVIDTSRVPLNMAGRWIMEGAKAIDARSIKPELSSLQAEVDPVLLKTIEEVLAEPK
jgi:cytidylate kinase